MKLNWVTALWEIIQTLATLSKDVEQANTDLKKLREDFHDLTLLVSDLKHTVAYEKATTAILLDGHKNQINHAEANVAAKFDVLATRLDAKMADFEHRLSTISSTPRRAVLLEGDPDNNESSASL